MALAIRNLSVVAYSNGFTLWHYKTTLDTLEMVMEDNYFEDAADMLTAGDMIMVSANGKARVVTVACAMVASVTIAPLS